MAEAADLTKDSHYVVTLIVDHGWQTGIEIKDMAIEGVATMDANNREAVARALEIAAEQVRRGVYESTEGAVVEAPGAKVVSMFGEGVIPAPQGGRLEPIQPLVRMMVDLTRDAMSGRLRGIVGAIGCVDAGHVVPQVGYVRSIAGWPNYFERMGAVDHLKFKEMTEFLKQSGGEV